MLKLRKSQPRDKEVATLGNGLMTHRQFLKWCGLAVAGAGAAGAGRFVTPPKVASAADGTFDNLTVNGTLGIGTPGPVAPLEISVAGNAFARTHNTTNAIDARYGADSIGGFFSVVTSHPLKLQTNNTERMRVDSTGNVGIGTADPTAAKLVVAGDILAAGTLQAYGGGLDGSNLQKLVIYADTTNGLYFDAPKDASGYKLPIQFCWRGGGAPALYMAGDGNTGVGWSSPTVKLHLAPQSFLGIPTNYGNIPNGFLRGTSGIILAGAASPDGVGWAFGSRLVTIDYLDGWNTEFDTIFYGGNWTNSALVISGRDGCLGSIGIGTPTPTEKLHVAGSAKIDGNLTVGGTVNANMTAVYSP
ncbi:MAG: hypothetical protein HY331_11690 [Chloroflexi bacterium]|nr:hypothetical protein [Chloroflexota bacterium]